MSTDQLAPEATRVGEFFSDTFRAPEGAGYVVLATPVHPSQRRDPEQTLELELQRLAGDHWETIARATWQGNDAPPRRRCHHLAPQGLVLSCHRHTVMLTILGTGQTDWFFSYDLRARVFTPRALRYALAREFLS